MVRADEERGTGRSAVYHSRPLARTTPSGLSSFSVEPRAVRCYPECLDEWLRHRDLGKRLRHDERTQPARPLPAPFHAADPPPVLLLIHTGEMDSPLSYLAL